ncbi:MAG: acyl-CoA dehydrogenase [Spirochaetes bacterium]|nr:acyl-CoA dehydrogenase [Spirochaetota bacterium]HOD13842.1 acyl-CoA dehydrogenase family protein [Spirochaetota bacterium]
MEKILLNPKQIVATYADEETRQIMLKTIDFFEGRGLKKMKDDFHACKWYTEFLDFMKENQIMAKLLTPSGFGGPASRWDTSRIVDFAEILGFYGLTYWYTFQVSELGLGPIFLGSNTEAKHKAANFLKEGAIFAFGLSEKEHGADIYSSDMMLYPNPDGTYRANGDKYYIGNGNEAAMVSTFGKIADSGDYVFFAVNSKHPKYECVKNIINNQDYVAEYALHDYPITEADILEKGQKAWDDMLNTINICKFNLGWASIGICEHAYYEAINHAAHRQLFGSFVTDFTHIKQLFMDAYCRLVAMKLFALRATDYMRSASDNDKRYLLYNPMVKMKVSTQGEEVINLLWDVIAAKGFEKDMYFENAATDIRALPKLEGTVHVNMALIIKFMPNYFFNPGQYPEIPQRRDAANDDFLFRQGPTKGLGKLQFHDYNIAYNSVDIPNVNVFKEQIAVFRDFMMASMATMKEQSNDIDFLLNVGELFTLVAYGQLILENKKIYGVEDDLIDQIFDFMVRDMSKFALTIYGKSITSEKQQELCLKMLRRPVVNTERYNRIYKDYVYALADTYKMND